MRIGVRLLLGYLLIVTIAGYFVLTIFLKEVKPGVRRATEGTLVDTANLLSHIVTQDLVNLTDLPQSDFYKAFSEVNKYPIGANIDGIIKNRMAYRVYITDINGIVLFDSSNNDIGKDYSRWNDVYLTLRGQYGARSSLDNPDDPTSTVMYVAAPLRIDGQLVGVLTIGKSNKSMEVVVQRGERRILISGLTLIGLALLIGSMFIWWINRSITKLIRYSDEVSNYKNTTLPKLDSPELQTLALALENMRNKLDGKDYIEKYVHTLTHELKSPLAAIRGATEILQDTPNENVQKHFIHNIDEQSRRLQQLIDRMLQQVKLEKRVGVDMQVYDLAIIIKECIENKQAQAQVANITLIIDDIVAKHFKFDKFLFTQALSNLLDNAIDFTPQGGKVTIAGKPEGDYYFIYVTDSGVGIPDFAEEKIFERFYSLARPNKPKSVGLGLAFVKEVAIVHQGDISLSRGNHGGTVACLTLKISL